MPTRIINGVNDSQNNNAYTSGSMVYVGDTVPYGRQAIDGSRPIRASGIHLDVWGSGGGGTLQLVMWDADGGGGAGTGVISVGSGPSRVAGSIDKYIRNAALQDILVGWNVPSRAMGFGRASVGGRTVVDGFGNYPGYSLTGLWTYEESPSAPRELAASSVTSTSVFLGWAAPADFGEAPITRYIVQRSTNAFASVAQQYQMNPGTITGLTPGVQQWFRVVAFNRVSDAFGVGSQVSNTITVTPKGGGDRWDGSAWDTQICERYDGSAWKPQLIDRFDGTTWKAQQ